MKRPIGIAIIAIVNFLSGIYSIIVGLGIGGIAGYKLSQGTDTTKEKEVFLGMEAGGILLLVIGILTLIAAIALWKLKTWAWYLAFLITAYHLFQSVYAGTQTGFDQNTIIHTAVYGIVFLYFLSVKKYFGRAS